MYINPQDLLYVIASICLLWITGFLCWALYETARLMRHSNEVVTEVQGAIESVEEVVEDVTDKFSSLSSYLGILTRAGESLLGGMMGGRRHRDEDEDDEEMPRVRRLKKSR